MHVGDRGQGRLVPRGAKAAPPQVVAGRDGHVAAEKDPDQAAGEQREVQPDLRLVLKMREDVYLCVCVCV